MGPKQLARGRRCAVLTHRQRGLRLLLGLLCSLCLADVVAGQFAEAFRAGGLKRSSRHHVHLSADPETARRVLLGMKAGATQDAAFEFFRVENGVWLVDRTSVEFLVWEAGEA